jgi:hypothetical protein
MAKTITKETKKEGQGKAKRCITCKNQKKEKANPSHGKKLHEKYMKNNTYDYNL